MRQLLRLARAMPTPERRRVVERRTLAEFRANASLADPAAVTDALLLAEVQIDNLAMQVSHLRELAAAPLIVPVDIHQRAPEASGASRREETERRDRERAALREAVRRRRLQQQKE
ncbi:hypothetical protein H9P43_007553 [Blastocladiella emersonii ATCC 22665]|nr:hypothetical protein H9P43_007553 [Blastocladiella emersonii ATCC 22665]